MVSCLFKLFILGNIILFAVFMNSYLWLNQYYGLNMLLIIICLLGISSFYYLLTSDLKKLERIFAQNIYNINTHTQIKLTQYFLKCLLNFFLIISEIILFNL